MVKRVDSVSCLEQHNISSEAINSQLNRILTSPTFLSSPQLRKFLQFVVSETLAGRADQIKQYTIGVRAYGYPANFDPRTDTVVRVHARRLRRALNSYYEGQGVEDPLIIEIPKGSYAPLIKPAETDVNAKANLSRFRHPSLAILPFKNLSDDPATAIFIDGFGEELSSSLARFQELAVVAYYSTSQLRKQNIGVQLAGERLGVEFVVTGAVIKTEKRLRITVSLSSTSSRKILWTRQFDRTLSAENFFDVQDEMVQQIVAEIGSKYGVVMRQLTNVPQPKRTQNLNSLEALLHFYHNQRNYSVETHLVARNALEHAVKLDPNYALNWAALGEIYCDAYVTGASEIDNLDQALKCVMRAISLDPMCQHAYHALAYVRLQGGDLQGAVEASEKVMELNPNAAYLVGTTGFWLVLAGKYERGLDIIKRSLQLNPYYPTWFHHAFFLNHYRSRIFEQALAEAKKFHMPEFFWDPLDKAVALSALGRTSEAEIAYLDVARLNPDFSNQPRYYLKAFVPQVDVQNQMLEDLTKAGLNL